MITTEQQQEYEEQLLTFNVSNEKFVQWNIADDKALRAIQLQMIDRFNYLVQENSADTWNNIKDSLMFQDLLPYLSTSDMSSTLNSTKRRTHQSKLRN